ncbi:MAG: ribonuclease HII [Dehalococcoidia bacterium]
MDTIADRCIFITRPLPGAERQAPTRELERAWYGRGARLVAGLDEVGRGPLAGPVVAGAVILHPRLDFNWIALLRDSNQLPEKRRDHLAERIHSEALATGIGVVSAQRIDEIGIAPASREAMTLALATLAYRPDALLLDAFPLPEVNLPQEAVIHGDATCSAIAAASIIAKVARDRMMLELEPTYPGYGFAHNRGYGTPEHLAALDQLGVCPIHRRSFAPVRRLVTE